MRRSSCGERSARADSPRSGKSLAPATEQENISANPKDKERLAKRLQVLDDHLLGKDYILGKDYSVVDAYVFTVLGWTKFVNVDLSKYANIGAYLGRVGARPAVQAALKAEGLVK